MSDRSAAKQPLVRPFVGLRPVPQHAAEVAAPPYDVLDSDEARALAAGKKWSFLHISKPEIDLAPGIDVHAREVYAKAAENMKAFIAAGVVRRDDKPAYYVYRVQMGDHVQTGLVAAGSVDAYEANLIRRHEHTRPDKEDDRVAQILAVEGHTGPVFCFHAPHADLTRIVAAATATAPAYAVTGPGGTQHSLWVIDDAADCASIGAAFQADGVIYIADGHHRSAAAARVRAQLRKQNPNHTGDELYNSFLIVSFPADQVRIYDYNRVVKDLNGLTPEAFLKTLESLFTITPAASAAKPTQAQTFGLYLAGKWYSLAFKQPQGAGLTPVQRLDVSLLQDHVLGPMLGIGDPRTDPRIDFVGGIRGMAELEKRVDSGRGAVAFALFATSIADLRAVADVEAVMPPKSTWFEPKLADGMVSLPLK
jgi:uncharacterized protein (DUF1015 family)